MAIKKKDFIEIDFTGSVKESGQIFDTTIREKAEKLGSDNPEKIMPLKVCVGEGMLVKGFDEALEGKEVGKDYSVEILPQKAFGARDPKLVKIIPISIFHEKEVNPYPGLVLDIDGILARISSVSGGRVTTDFNLPLAGKTVIYDFKIKRIIESGEEKLKALAEFYFGKADVRIEEKKAEIILEKKADSKSFAAKAKELTGFDVELKSKP